MNNNKNYRIMKFFEQAEKTCNGKGYVKIDMRGNRGLITVNVENLGEFKDYSDVYLFKNKEEKIKIGQIGNKKGKLQKNILLNGKDEPIENYNICGIVNQDKILLYTPVFVPAQVNQLSILLEKEDNENSIQCEDELEDELDNPIGENTKADNEEDTVPTENISEKKDDIIDEIDKTETDTENNVDVADEQVSMQNAAPKTSKTYRNEYERKLYTLLNEFEVIKPLAHDIKSINWWKVIYDENSIYKGFLPYFNQIITTYYPYPLSNRVTTCQALMQKHGYYLFGIYEQNKTISKFVYGIPGKFTRDEQPYRGVTGFKNWSYKNNDIPGDYGYWIAFIDANNGSVCDPPNVE